MPQRVGRLVEAGLCTPCSRWTHPAADVARALPSESAMLPTEAPCQPLYLSEKLDPKTWSQPTRGISPDPGTTQSVPKTLKLGRLGLVHRELVCAEWGENTDEFDARASFLE